MPELSEGIDVVPTDPLADCVGFTLLRVDGDVESGPFLALPEPDKEVVGTLDRVVCPVLLGADCDEEADVEILGNKTD